MPKTNWKPEQLKLCAALEAVMPLNDFQSAGTIAARLEQKRGVRELASLFVQLQDAGYVKKGQDREGYNTWCRVRSFPKPKSVDDTKQTGMSRRGCTLGAPPSWMT